MKIAVLGTGSVGRTLARRWAAAGNDVWLGSRDTNRQELRQFVEQGDDPIELTDLRGAAAAADVIVLAIPWPAAQQTLEQLGDLSGKIVIDCINPINAEFTGLDLGYSVSGAERIAEWSVGAQVVKAFNTVSAATMADPAYGEHQATVFYCGDNDQAKAVVHELAEQLGFEPVDAGALGAARHLEPLAMLYIHLAIFKGWGSNCAFKVLRRDSQ